VNKIIILLAFSFLSVSQTIHATEVSAEKKALIDQLMAQTGQPATSVGEQFSNSFIQQMTMMLKRTNPNVDPKAYKIMSEEVHSVVKAEAGADKTLSEIMYPVYDKHFTTEDLSKIVEFNNSPVGQKLQKVMPMITQEGMKVGQTFGQTVAPKIQQRLRARFQQEGIDVR